jgi:hypothetical protein
VRLASEMCRVFPCSSSLLQFSFNHGNKHLLSFNFRNLKTEYSTLVSSTELYKGNGSTIFPIYT